MFAIAVVLALIVVLSISSFCSAVAVVFGLHLRHSSSPFVSSFLRRYRRPSLRPRLFDITAAPLPPRAGLLEIRPCGWFTSLSLHLDFTMSYCVVFLGASCISASRDGIVWGYVFAF
jgi:hypothetical protein